MKPKSEKQGHSLLREIVGVVVTFAILGAALFIVLKPNYDAVTRSWAFNVINIVAAVWLTNKFNQRKNR